MNIKTRSSMPTKIEESNSLMNDDGSLNLSDDERAFQFFFREQIEKEDMECSSENELKMRARWNCFKNSKKKSFIKSNAETLRGLKRIHSQILTVEKSVTSNLLSINKKIKLDEIENCNKREVSINPADQFFQQEIQRLIASPAQYNFQPVCHVCEEFIDSVNIKRCTGDCLRYYHRTCLEYPPENPLLSNSIFQCPDCWTETYSCILCKKTDKFTSLLYCENKDCGRLYHKHCLDKSNMAYSGLTKDRINSCPAHFCVTCSKEDPTSVLKPCNKLFQCIRCPMAFHDAELCMAAGAVELSLSHVVCPRHFEASLIKINSNKPIHTDWCFRCFKPGSKLQCHYCPGSYHQECVSTGKKNPDTKETTFVCGDCRNHRQPRYGEIVFVKVGFYRWWPCEVIHPRNAPMNILKLKRPDGTFPILFLGSHEYQWVTKSRTIYYNIAQLSPVNKETGGTHKMDREFNQGLKDAARMHKVFVNIVMKKVPLTSIKAEPMTKTELSRYIDFKDTEKRTVKYKLIKTNVVVLPAKLPTKKNHTICDCIDRCLLHQCKNSLNKIECEKEMCPTKDLCQNRPFTSHTNKSLGVNKTSNRGFGLKTSELLKQNEFIIEYVGEVITKLESVARINEAKKTNVKDFYMIRLSGDLIVDAGPKGNFSRFINHACDPNCRLERWTVNGYVRLGIFANRDIEPGEELTFDYRLSGVIMKEDIFCFCNTVNCSGFLGPEKISAIGIHKINAKNVVQDLQSLPSPIIIVDGKDNDSELEEVTESTLSINIESMKVNVMDEYRVTEVESPVMTSISPDKSDIAQINCQSDQLVPITIDLCDDQDDEQVAPKIPLVCRESPLRIELAKIQGDMSSSLETSTTKEAIKIPQKFNGITNNIVSNKEWIRRRIKRHSVDTGTTISLEKEPLKEVTQISDSPEDIESSKNLTMSDNGVDVVKRRRIRRFKEPLVSEKVLESQHKSDFILPSENKRDPTKKVDLITECILATDAAVEKSTKKISIKDIVLPSQKSHNSMKSWKTPLSVRTKKEVKTITEGNTTSTIKTDESLDVISRKDFTYESFCFRCFDGGELVLCDKQGCTKTYHLSCIGLKKAPLGTWYCPWHFCNVCGEPSSLFCVQCPGSYCPVHCVDVNILTPSSGSRLSWCHYHKSWKDRLNGVTTNHIETEH